MDNEVCSLRGETELDYRDRTGFSGSFEDTNQNCRVTVCLTQVGLKVSSRHTVVTFAGSMEVNIILVGSMSATALHLSLYF